MQISQKSQDFQLLPQVNPNSSNDPGSGRQWSVETKPDSSLLLRAIESHPDLTFLLLDLGGRLITWNASAETLLGYTETEAMGMAFTALYTADTPSAAYPKQVLKAAARDGKMRIPANAKPKTQSAFRVEIEITPLPDEKLGLIGFSLMLRKTEPTMEKNASTEPEPNFQTLVDTLPVFIWKADTNGYVTYANQTWQDYIGGSFEGSLGHAYQKILHPNDLQSTLDRYAEAARTREPFELECQMRRQDGQYRWIHYSGLPQISPSGSFEGFFGVGMDISWHKANELALQESEQRFRMLTDDIPVMIWMADEHTRVTHVNKACCEFFGHDLNAFLGQEAELTAHPDDLERVLSIYKSAVKARQSYTLECRAKRSDGEYRWVLYRGVPRLLPDGEFLGFIGVGIDITDRKNAELAITESEVRFRTLADASPTMIWMMDDKYNMVYANKALLDFYGQPLDAIGNTGWKPYIDAESLEKIYPVLNEAIANKSIYEIEVRKKRADGEYRWVLVRGAPRFQQDGTYLGIVGSSVDITELRESRAILETQVQERTRQLELANKELESFAYSVSHDLRAPLRSIDGFSKMLLNKNKEKHAKLDDDEQRYLNYVCDNTQRMGELIDDLLKLSRLSRSEMVYTQVDLSRMSREILSHLQAQEPQRLVDIQVTDDLIVNGDAQLLRIVLENLLGNAWKYTGKKERAHIEVGRRDEDGMPVYYVKDNGAGFNMKYAGKLFGAFQRLHRIDEFPGSGIGLATVQRVMNRHGGRIWAEAEPNQGATFYFAFF